MSFTEIEHWVPLGVSPTTRQRWIDAVGATNALALARAGVAVEDLPNWRRAGFDLADIAEWATTGLPLAQAHRYRLDGVSATDASVFAREGVGPADARAWIRRFRATDAIKWRELGFTPAEAARWAELEARPEMAQRTRRVFTADQAAAFIAHGGQLVDAVAWHQAGVPTAFLLKMLDGWTISEARAWPATGLPLAQIDAWRSEGFNPDDTPSWYATGLDPDLARAWRDAGHTPAIAMVLARQISADIATHWDPDEAEAWIGTRLARVEQWRHARFTPDETIEWAATGLAPDQARAWCDAGFAAAAAAQLAPQFTAEQAAPWANTNLAGRDIPQWLPRCSPERATALLRAFSDPKRPLAWAASTLPADLCPRWDRQGVTPEVAERMHERGMTPEEYATWQTRLGDVDPLNWIVAGWTLHDAARWCHVGDPSTATRWRSHDFAPGEAVSAIRRGVALEDANAARAAKHPRTRPTPSGRTVTCAGCHVPYEGTEPPPRTRLWWCSYCGTPPNDRYVDAAAFFLDPDRPELVTVDDDPAFFETAVSDLATDEEPDDS